MEYGDSIVIEEDETAYQSERRAVFEPAIRSIASALGGLEKGVYRMGDECYGCLKDLKKLWKKDDTDDERTVARIFYEVQVLPNDLIPIVMSTTSADELEDKRAIAAADLICAMTWPIDLAEELKELDEEEDAKADFTQLLRSHLHYKQALLKPGVLRAFLSITIPCLGRDSKVDRSIKERDSQIVHLVLHVIRNLAFIRDPQAGANASPEAIEMSMMQSRLVQALSECHFFDLLVTIAANASTNTIFNSWNVTALEILYLFFRGVKADVLAVPSTEAKTGLRDLLEQEDREQKAKLRTGASRHSRFGTTVAVTQRRGKAQGGPVPETDIFGAGPDGPRTLVIHRQRAIKEGAGAVLDTTSGKKSKSVRQKKTDEVGGREDNMGHESKRHLRNFIKEFMKAGFNPLVASLLKDIKSERAKITEKDHLRLLHVTKWFMTFCRLTRSATGPAKVDISFGLLAEVTERGWIAWVLKRMREAVEVKPKAWNELQSGLECLTELILLIEAMSHTAVSLTDGNEAESLADTAQLLQEQLVYNGEVLELSLEALRAYRDGTQALAYLDAAVHLGWALLRMLEKWTREQGGKEMVVQSRSKARKKKKKTTSTEEGEGVPDVDEDEQAAFEEQEREREENIREALFTFEAFELRFAHPDVTATLLTYLARFREFGIAHEKMKRVVGLLHRQAIRAKAEGLFFRTSTLDLFRNILAESKTLPRDQAYKDLVSLINFILRKFFKAVEQDSFLIIEAFFPKNRGHWKDHSSLTAEELALKTGKVLKQKSVVDTRFPPDVKVKKGWNWSDQVGIAVQALVEDGHEDLVDWSKELLLLVHVQRQRIAEDMDGSPSQKNDGDDEMNAEDDVAVEAEHLRRMNGPSAQAREQFTDYVIPYASATQADGASKNVHLKLLFRLLEFTVVNEDDETAVEIQWAIPKTIMPEQLQRCASIIAKYLKTPIDLQGKAANTELAKQPLRRRRRRSPSPGLSDSDDDLDFDAIRTGRPNNSEERERRKAEKQARKEAKAAARAQRKKKEEKQYKSRQFIEDSDAEQDDEAFWERERQLRLRMEAAGEANLPPVMKASGTRKRKKALDVTSKNRKKKRGARDTATLRNEEDPAGTREADEDDEDARPGSPVTRGLSEVPSQLASDDEDLQATPTTRPPLRPKARPRPRPIKQSTSTREDAATSGSSRQSSIAPSEVDIPDMSIRGQPSATTSKRNRVIISDEED